MIRLLSTLALVLMTGPALAQSAPLTLPQSAWREIVQRLDSEGKDRERVIMNTLIDKATLLDQIEELKVKCGAPCAPPKPPSPAAKTTMAPAPQPPKK